MRQFSIEITVDTGGVQAVRIYGESWEHSTAAYDLLERLGPLIQQVDAVAKAARLSVPPLSPDGGAVQ